MYSTLAHQHRKHISDPECIITVAEVPTPTCPRLELRNFFDKTSLEPELEALYDEILCTKTESDSYELATRTQSRCPDWKRLRQNRLTASRFKQISSRQKNHILLAKQLISGKTVQTAAIAWGLELEPKAAEVYAQTENVNVYTIGLVINPSASHLACSPDRLVYDPTAPDNQKWGLMEIKCPHKTSYKDCEYLKNKSNSNEYTLKKSHEYYYQITGQLGLTGFTWCDFMVFCIDDFIIERISFDQSLFNVMKEKLEKFYIKLVFPCIKQ